MKAIDICFPCEILISKHTPQGKKKKKKTGVELSLRKNKPRPLFIDFFFQVRKKNLTNLAWTLQVAIHVHPLHPLLNSHVNSILVH